MRLFYCNHLHLLNPLANPLTNLDHISQPVGSLITTFLFGVDDGDGVGIITGLISSTVGEGDSPIVLLQDIGFTSITHPSVQHVLQHVLQLIVGVGVGVEHITQHVLGDGQLLTIQHDCGEE